MKKIIILLGIPGSGKGTQAELLASRYNYKHISTGNLLRALDGKENLDEELQKAMKAVHAGHLVDSKTIYRLAFEEIEKHLKEGSGIFLDGAIRSAEQAAEYQKFFVEKGLQDEVVVVELTLDDETSFKRLTKRKVCESCGHIIPYSPDNDKKTTCEKCSGNLMVRSDDVPEIIKQRIEEQGNKALKPIVDFYKDLGVLSVVDGSQSISQVDKEVMEILES